MSTTRAHASASGPSTSHRNSGTPASRSMLRMLGIVHTRESPVACPVCSCTESPAIGFAVSCRWCGRGEAVHLTLSSLARASGPLVVRAVPDLADQLLEHVLEGDQSEDCPLGGDDA